MHAVNNLELHPLCVIFPRMSGPEFAALCADIRANGLRTPIVLHGGMILDGGNRYRACQETGARMEFVEFVGGNLVSFVLSANLHRRHMTAGQQAAIVSSAQDWAKAQSVGKPSKSGNVAGLATVADRAAQSGASDRTQRMADHVARADPELALQVAHGEVSLPKAHAAVAESKKAATPELAHPAPAAARVAPTVVTTVSTETASPVTPEQRAPGPVTAVPASTEAPEDAADDGGMTYAEALDEIQKLHAEVATMRALLAAAEANDLKAEAIKWRRAYEHAQRTADEKMGNAARLERELQQLNARMLRIGKLFGERDATKIPALVEAFHRQHAKAVA
jgi:hypothetical protein